MNLREMNVFEGHRSFLSVFVPGKVNALLLMCFPSHGVLCLSGNYVFLESYYLFVAVELGFSLFHVP